MPIYDYKCSDCEKVYDIFHKVREVVEDVICPACGSSGHIRLISVPAAMPGKRSGPGSRGEDLPPCGDSGCCGGTCSLN